MLFLICVVRVKVTAAHIPDVSSRAGSCWDVVKRSDCFTHQIKDNNCKRFYQAAALFKYVTVKIVLFPSKEKLIMKTLKASEMC